MSDALESESEGDENDHDTDNHTDENAEIVNGDGARSAEYIALPSSSCQLKGAPGPSGNLFIFIVSLQ